VPVEGGEIARGVKEEASDHDRLGDIALADVGGGLERLVGLAGEAVEVEAVVPVGAADERQAVRAAVAARVGDRDLEVLEKRRL